jgi:hypothetical protein
MYGLGSSAADVSERIAPSGEALPPDAFSALSVPSIEFECPGRERYVYSPAAEPNDTSTDSPGEASVVQPTSLSLISIGT